MFFGLPGCAALGLTKSEPTLVPLVVEHKGGEYEICSVQLARKFTNAWGENQIRDGKRVQRGEQYQFDIQQYVEFAIRVEDCNHTVIYQSPKHFIGEASVLTFVADGGTMWGRLGP